jgi:hypothetical protein
MTLITVFIVLIIFGFVTRHIIREERKDGRSQG